MAKSEKPKVVSRKRVARVERDRTLNRALVIVTGVIVALVLGLVSWGLIRENFVYPRQTVAVVEGQEILGGEFQTRVRVNRQQLIGQYVEYAQTIELFGADEQFQQQLYNQMIQIYFQLQPETVGSSTINQLVDDRLIVLEAQSLGIEISEEQIDEELQQFLGYFPDGRPTPSTAPTLLPTSTLSATQYALVSPTPTRTASPTATATSRIPTATATAEATPEGGDTAEPSPTPAVLPTATPYTLEGFQQVLEEYVNAQNRDIGLAEADLRELLRVNLYREAMFEQITADVAPEQEQVWARHILVPDEETAETVLQRLDRGEDWAKLAEELSIDTSNSANGGDLGWFTEGIMVEEFSQAAFALRVGQISDPVESSAGWHIIQLLGHETRPLSTQELAGLKQTAFEEFIAGLREKYEWEIFDNWQIMTPEDPEIPIQYQLGF
jgi:hypothetical protein